MARAPYMGPSAVQGSSCVPWTGLGSKHLPWSGQSKLCCGLPQHPCVVPFAGTPCHPDPHLPSLTHCHSRSSISSPSPENAGHPFPAAPAETPAAGPVTSRGPALAGPAPGAVSPALSTRLALLTASTAWLGPHGIIVPLLGQPERGLALREVWAAPFWNLLPHRLALPARPGSHPVQGSGKSSSISSGLVAVQSRSWDPAGVQ